MASYSLQSRSAPLGIMMSSRWMNTPTPELHQLLLSSCNCAVAGKTPPGTGRGSLLKCSALLYFPVVSSCYKESSMATTVRHGMVDGALVLLPPAPGVSQCPSLQPFCSLLLGPCDVSISRWWLPLTPRVHTYPWTA
jgi:hypothetical protein